MAGVEVRNGDVTLHVEDDGDPDAPPVVLLHGITMSTATWDWLVPDLAADHRVLRLDFRGHGRSDRAPGAYSYEGYVGDAVAACEQLAGRPAIVIGHSLGGGTAAALAQTRPDLVVAAVLEDPPLVGPGEMGDNTLLEGFRLLRASVPRLQAGDGIPRDVLADRLGRAPSPAGPPFGELLCPDGLTAMAESLLALDATVLDPVVEGRIGTGYDAAAPFATPALVLAADPKSPDAVVRPQDLERLAAVSPHVEARVVPGASHFLHDERANRGVFRDAVLAFVAAHRPA